MNDKINAKEILNKLSNKDYRKKVSLYLSVDLYKQFKNACGKTSSSQVVEELIKHFLDSLKSN